MSGSVPRPLPAEDEAVTVGRPEESEVMALLEQVIATAEDAERYVQDDSHIPSRSDRREIIDRLHRIRALTLEIEHLIENG